MNYCATSFCVYIMSNRYRTVRYVGVTNNLARRRQEHRDEGPFQGFCGKYRVHDVIYVEWFGYIDKAIAREKELKNAPKAYKISLAEALNPDLISLEPPFFLTPEKK
jgi:putative endonuclease